MSFFSVNINKLALNSFPPDKRYKKNNAFITALLSPLQSLRDWFFGQYYEGGYDAWEFGATYAKGDKVLYKGIIYVSLIDNNTYFPFIKTYYTEASEYPFGAKEQISYTSQKLVLEYALNKKFSTEFRQPPYVSDIFITNNYLVERFYVGSTEPHSSYVGITNNKASFIGNTEVIESINFTVNVPTSTYNDYENNYCKISAFINTIIPIGLTYTFKQP